MVAAAVIVPMLIDLSMKSRRDDGVDRDRQQRWETHTRRISKRDIMLRSHGYYLSVCVVACK